MRSSNQREAFLIAPATTATPISAQGPILNMYITGQIRIFKALKSDGYSTGNAPPSGNNTKYYHLIDFHFAPVRRKTIDVPDAINWLSANVNSNLGLLLLTQINCNPSMDK